MVADPRANVPEQDLRLRKGWARYGMASILGRMAYVSAMTSPPLVPDKPCPICSKPSVEKFRPFCSRRCGDVDLSRWLKGVYVVPTDETDDERENPRPAGAKEE